MTNKELIKLACSVIKKEEHGDCCAGTVGSALIADGGKVYTGVCIDVSCGMGFCAEHNAIGSMVTEGVYKIKKIVAVWKNEKGEAFVLHPCGRCREFMRQVHEDNMEAEVILGPKRVVKLRELLPYDEDYAKAE